jgi:hypothetical protein
VTIEETTCEANTTVIATSLDKSSSERRSSLRSSSARVSRTEAKTSPLVKDGVQLSTPKVTPKVVVSKIIIARNAASSKGITY